MNDIARQQLLKALNATGPAQVQAIEALRDAEQLHQFALNYNINDGFLPIGAVITHPACDKGTALYIYWLFEEHHGEKLIAQKRSPEFDVSTLLTDTVRRLTSDSFATADIFFDPAAAFTEVALYKLRKQSRDRFLEAVGNRKLEREWL